ncbi:hypothetical protein ACJX0J_021502, partial [Zea mays]
GLFGFFPYSCVFPVRFNYFFVEMILHRVGLKKIYSISVLYTLHKGGGGGGGLGTILDGIFVSDNEVITSYYSIFNSKRILFKDTLHFHAIKLALMQCFYFVHMPFALATSHLLLSSCKIIKLLIDATMLTSVTLLYV